MSNPVEKNYHIGLVFVKNDQRQWQALGEVAADLDWIINTAMYKFEIRSSYKIEIYSDKSHVGWKKPKFTHYGEPQ